MKKKTRIIVAAAFSCLLLLFAGVLLWSPFQAATGIYINAGSPVIVFDKGSGEPVVLLASGRKEGMFANLRTGDRVLIVHNGTMMLSYPAQMNAYFCFRLKKGDISDVPEAALNSLEELGWRIQGGSFGQNK